MIIHNGDHAQFEIDNAGVPPEQRPDWPLPSFKAEDWAKAFCKAVRAQDPIAHLNEQWMTAWFANALMRGYDEGVAAAQNGEAK